MTNKTKILNKIKFYYKNSDFESVLNVIKKFDINGTDSKEILYIIALAYDQVALRKDKQEMKNMQKLAKKYASITINKFPSWGNGYFVMGLIFQHSGDSETALKFYKKAQKINPKKASYYLSLGNGYRAAKKYQPAKYWYKKALKIKNIKHLAAVNLVSLYQELKDKKLVNKYAEKSLQLMKYKKDRFSLDQKERMRDILKI